MRRRPAARQATTTCEGRETEAAAEHGVLGESSAWVPSTRLLAMWSVLVTDVGGESRWAVCAEHAASSSVLSSGLPTAWRTAPEGPSALDVCAGHRRLIDQLHVPSYVGVVTRPATQARCIDRLSTVSSSWCRVVRPLALRLGRLGPGDVGVQLHGRPLGRFVTLALGLGGRVRVQRLVVNRGSGLHGGPPLLAQLLCSSFDRSQGERVAQRMRRRRSHRRRRR